jgi:quercetin dioxygenase-like cupin family protein
MPKHSFTPARRAATSLAFVGAAALTVISLPSSADHGLPHVETLSRGAFLDQVGVTIKYKIDGQSNRTEWNGNDDRDEHERDSSNVIKIRDASDLVVLRITIEPGGIAPWHGHTGTGLLVNTGPGTLTNYVGENCEPRLIYPGQAFLDPGHDMLHAVRNNSAEDVVLVATFIGVEGAPVTPEPQPDYCQIF